MKRILLFAFVLAFATVANADSALLKLGLKGGLNVSHLSTPSNYSSSNSTGFFCGPTLKLDIPVVNFGFDTGLLYSQASYDVGQRELENVKTKLISIPINLRYYIGLGDMANIFFYGGPQYDYNIGGRSDYWDDYSYGYRQKQYYMSVNLGLGATIASHLQLSVNYNIACGHTSNFVDTVGGMINSSSKTNMWQVGVGYWF